MSKKDTLIHTNKAQKAPDNAKPRSVIKVPVQLYRTTTDLSKYRTAVQAAENYLNPYRYSLYQLYNQAVLDPQISAAWQQRKNMILGSEFCVYNKDGKENEEKTQIIRRKWFRDFIDISLDANLWGHSLIQFDDIITINGVDEFKEVELVPREYVKPEFHMIMETTASLPPEGKDYLELPFCNWSIGVGKKRDLGLLLKLTPLYIWKKNALGAWAEFIEKFGSPVRIGKTDSTDLESVSQMEGMLKNMGIAAWGLFKLDDEIELIESNHSDAFQVFDKMIERCNSEISKLILGQTMTTDNGSSRSQAEVHERILESFGDMDKQFIRSVLNDQLLPLMNRLGFGLDGCYIDLEQEDEWSLDDKSKFDIELLKTGKFTFSPEYIKEKYGTEVVPVQQDNTDNYKNRLGKYYKT